MKKKYKKRRGEDYKSSPHKLKKLFKYGFLMHYMG